MEQIMSSSNTDSCRGLSYQRWIVLPPEMWFIRNAGFDRLLQHVIVLLNASQKFCIIHSHSFLIGNYAAICPCCYSKKEDKVVIQKVVDWQTLAAMNTGVSKDKCRTRAMKLQMVLGANYWGELLQLTQTPFLHQLTSDLYLSGKSLVSGTESCAAILHKQNCCCTSCYNSHTNYISTRVTREKSLALKGNHYLE